MNKQQNRAEELAQKYWSATLSPLEEQELRSILKKIDSPTQELAALKIMLEGFSALGQEQEPQAKAKPSRARIIHLVSSISAVAAVVAIALIVHFDTPATPETEVYCYINGEPITDIEVAMEQTKYLASLSSLDKSIDLLKSFKTN